MKTKNESLEKFEHMRLYELNFSHLIGGEFCMEIPGANVSIHFNVNDNPWIDFMTTVGDIEGITFEQG